jgi:hypothetical protein
MNIKQSQDKYWIRFGDPEQSSSYTGDLAGKYLFFSKEQQPLIDIAKNEIENHGFEVAKVSQDNRSGDFVLCLYWEADIRGYELRDRYMDVPDIKYRWWKSNADTRAGKYSERFRNSLPCKGDFRGDDGIFEI